MHKIFILRVVNVYAISFMMLSNSFAVASQSEQEQLQEAVSNINHSLTSINNSTPIALEYCADCNALNPRVDCAPETFEALDDIYSNGTVGALSFVFAGEQYKDPRSICNSSLTSSYRPSYLELAKDLEEKYPSMATLKDFSNGCFENASIEEYIESGRKKTDLELAKAYVLMDFHVKNQKIADESIRLFEAKNQLANLIDASASNCSLVRDRSAKSRCEDLQKCNNKKKDELVAGKVDELSSAIESLKLLNKEKNDLEKRYRNPKGIYPAHVKADIKTISDNIEIIKQINPVLLSDDFKKINDQIKDNSPVNSSSIKNSYIKTLKTSAAKIDERISQVNKAQRCVLGEESKCSDSNKLLSSLRYKDANKVYIEKNSDGKRIIRNQLNVMNSFYSCTQDSIESRNKADDVLDEVGITLALTIATFGLGTALAGGANLLKMANTAVKAKNISTLATTSGDFLYAGAVGANNYSECSELENELKTFSQAPTISCEDVTVNMYKSSNMNRCYLSAALSTAGVAAGAGLALKFLRVPKATTPITKPTTSTKVAITTPEVVKTKAITSTPKINGVSRESKDAAGNLWQYSDETKKIFRNGEEVFLTPGINAKFRNASGKEFEIPLEMLKPHTAKAPLALSSPAKTELIPSVVSRELSTVTPRPIPNAIKDITPSRNSSITLTNKADDAARAISTHYPVTAGAASSAVIASGKLADKNLAIPTFPSEGSSGSDTSTDEATSIPKASDISEGPSEDEAREVSTDTAAPDESTTTTPNPDDFASLIKFKSSSDDCNVTIKADLKEAKEKYKDISCKYTTCNEEKYNDSKTKCENEAFESKAIKFDRREKGYYLYPICSLSKEKDATFSFIKLADNKIKRILISSYDEMVSCKNEKEMELPNLVIPDSAPNVGQPNLMEAPSAPILIEY